VEKIRARQPTVKKKAVEGRTVRKTPTERRRKKMARSPGQGDKTAGRKTNSAS
jgi:hypothetical protein